MKHIQINRALTKYPTVIVGVTFYVLPNSKEVTTLRAITFSQLIFRWGLWLVFPHKQVSIKLFFLAEIIKVGNHISDYLKGTSYVVISFQLGYVLSQLDSYNVHTVIYIMYYSY